MARFSYTFCQKRSNEPQIITKNINQGLRLHSKLIIIKGCSGNYFKWVDILTKPVDGLMNITFIQIEITL